MFAGFEIDDQSILGRCLHRTVGDLLTPEDTIDVNRSLADVGLPNFGPWEIKPPASNKVTAVVSRWQPVLRGIRNYEVPTAQC